MFIGDYYLDPIYIVLITIITVLVFLGLVYRMMAQFTLLLKEIRDENKVHTGKLDNITAPRIRIVFPEQYERDTSGGIMRPQRPKEPIE